MQQQSLFFCISLRVISAIELRAEGASYTEVLFSYSNYDTGTHLAGEGDLGKLQSSFHVRGCGAAVCDRGRAPRRRGRHGGGRNHRRSRRRWLVLLLLLLLLQDHPVRGRPPVHLQGQIVASQPATQNANAD
jgi:hypothetical protein